MKAAIYARVSDGRHQTTAGNSREIFFIPGSPVIVVKRYEVPIGTIFKRMDGGNIGGRSLASTEQPHAVKRAATLEEYLSTVRPEYRELLRKRRPPPGRSMLLKPEDSELSAIEILEECAWEVHHSVWEDDRLRRKAERKINGAIDYLKES